MNSVGLPFGLTYMVLLAPLLYVWMLLTRKRDILFPFIAVLLPFLITQILMVGVDMKTYFLSSLNIFMVYIFCQAVYTFLTRCSDPEKVFRYILIVNFALCLIAIPLYFTSYSSLFWVEQNITEGVSFKRLKLLTYEPSYYALLFTPFFFFYLLAYFFKLAKIRSYLLFPMLFLPFVLSFSIGVMSSIIVALLLTWVFYFVRLTKIKRVFNAIIYAGLTGVTSAAILFVVNKDNIIFSRIRNILNGEDTSGNGRTVDAFILAQKLLKEKSEYWGVGLGQIKLVGQDIIRGYYLYYWDYVVAIPNAAAETLAIFGWVGFSLRMLLELFFFFHTRVWSNYYRLLLFLFIFVYQFTGSFITNGAEYVIWILAFTNTFKQFDVKPRVSTLIPNLPLASHSW
jgi:hypothetical protein